MLDKEVISASFIIRMKSGVQIEYINSEKEEFQWALTQSGGILIYRKQFHQTFGAVIKDGRIHAYAEGTWQEIEVLEEGEDAKAPVIATPPKDYVSD